MVVFRAAVGPLKHHCALWHVPRSGRVTQVGVRVREVREGDGDLVLIVAVMGLLDPQRQLQQVLQRRGAAQVPMRAGEVCAGDGDLAVTRAVVVATSMPNARCSTSLFVAGLPRAMCASQRPARVAATW